MQTVVSTAKRESKALKEELEQDANPSPDSVREQLFKCEFIDFIFNRQWQRVDGFMNRGIEGKKLIFFIKEFRDALSLGIQAFDKVSKRIGEVRITEEEKKEAILNLEQWATRSRKMVDQLSKLLLTLETSPPEVDIASLRAAGTEKQVKGFISSREFFSRLHSAEEKKRMA